MTRLPGCRRLDDATDRGRGSRMLRPRGAPLVQRERNRRRLEVISTEHHLGCSHSRRCIEDLEMAWALSSSCDELQTLCARVGRSRSRCARWGAVTRQENWHLRWRCGDTDAQDRSRVGQTPLGAFDHLGACGHRWSESQHRKSARGLGSPRSAASLKCLIGASGGGVRSPLSASREFHDVGYRRIALGGSRLPRHLRLLRSRELRERSSPLARQDQLDPDAPHFGPPVLGATSQHGRPARANRVEVTETSMTPFARVARLCGGSRPASSACRKCPYRTIRCMDPPWDDGCNCGVSRSA